MTNPNISDGDSDFVPSAEPLILDLARHPFNREADSDERAAAFIEACRLAANDKARHPQLARDRNGQAHWAAHYPHVFTFDGQLRGMFDLVHSDPGQRPDEQLALAEGFPGGALTHVIIETDADERMLIRKVSGGVQSALYQTFNLTSTGMARQAAQQGKLLEPRPIATETLAGVVLVPGMVMQLGYDPHTRTHPRSRGNITRITGLQMDEAGKAAPDTLQLQQLDLYTDTYDVFKGHLRSIEATRAIGSEALRQIRIQKNK